VVANHLNFNPSARTELSTREEQEKVNNDENGETGEEHWLQRCPQGKEGTGELKRIRSKMTPFPPPASLEARTFLSLLVKTTVGNLRSIPMYRGIPGPIVLLNNRHSF
jgi:hypothetical protein